MVKIILVVAVLFCSCGTSKPPSYSFDDSFLLKKALQENTPVYSFDYAKIEKEANDFYENSKVSPIPSADVFVLPAEAEYCLPETKELLELTVKVFSTIRENYIGYCYFGGDARFKEAFLDIVNRLMEHPRTFPVEYYTSFLCSELSFIKDCHFSIDRKSISSHRQEYYCKEYFYPVEDTWLFELDGLWHILDETPDNKSFIDSLKPTIKTNGSIAWIAILETSDSQKISIRRAGAKRSYKITLDVYPVKDSPNMDPSVSFEKEMNGSIPVCTISSCLNSITDPVASNIFFEYAKEIDKAELALIDLRFNPGGSDYDFERWFEVFVTTAPLSSTFGWVSKERVWIGEKPAEESGILDRVRDSRVKIVLQSPFVASADRKSVV